MKAPTRRELQAARSLYAATARARILHALRLSLAVESDLASADPRSASPTIQRAVENHARAVVLMREAADLLKEER